MTPISSRPSVLLIFSSFCLSECHELAEGKQACSQRQRHYGGCIVLLRHGEREDFMARKVGNGAKWVANADRPWDPRLAENGHEQAKAAAKRVRQVLGDHSIPMPSRIYTSPLVRCLETSGHVAEEFNISSLLVEEGLTETMAEGWMRQWAVPGANTHWGGPPDHAMPKHLSHNYIQELQGPPIPEKDLLPEAVTGARALLRKAVDLKSDGWSLVNASHSSHVDMQAKGYRWGSFETESGMDERLDSTMKYRLAEHPNQTLVFVSHGGPTKAAFKVIKGRDTTGEGGMTCMSVLRVVKDGNDFQWEESEVVLDYDASHAEAFRLGEETKI